MKAQIPNRRPIVGVMGSGREAHRPRAQQVGTWLAQYGYHLLTGGGRGVMEAVSEAFCRVQSREGLVLAVIPCAAGDPLCRPIPGYPNPWVEIPIFTHLDSRGKHGGKTMSRNHINVLSSDVVIALPGGGGTSSEIRLALQYRRPLIAYVEDQSAIENMPEDVTMTNDFASVQDFVRANT